MIGIKLASTFIVGFFVGFMFFALLNASNN